MKGFKGLKDKYTIFRRGEVFKFLIKMDGKETIVTIVEQRQSDARDFLSKKLIDLYGHGFEFKLIKE